MMMSRVAPSLRRPGTTISVVVASNRSGLPGQLLPTRRPSVEANASKMNNAFPFDVMNVVKLATVAAASSVLVLTGPATAALDTDTFKAGPGATIEYSDIGDQSAADVVRSLKDEVLPQIKEKLESAAGEAGSKFPESVVKELDTVKGEIDALDKQLKGGSGSPNIKSAASAIEQQLNALKATLGFD